MKRNMDLLPQVAFSILLALSLKPRHGYEIMKQVEIDSDGKIKLGAGALYASIKILKEARYIEEVDPTDLETRGRRYYKLSESGWGRLSQELQYFQDTVAIAKQRVYPVKGSA